VIRLIHVAMMPQAEPVSTTLARGVATNFRHARTFARGRELFFGVSEKRSLSLHRLGGRFMLLRATRKPVKNSCASLLLAILFFGQEEPVEC
jgi:hypothetical protein